MSQEILHFFHFFAEITHFSIKLSCFYPYTLHYTLYTISSILKISFHCTFLVAPPIKDQGETKEEPRNDQTKKVLFVKITISH